MMKTYNNKDHKISNIDYYLYLDNTQYKVDTQNIYWFYIVENKSFFIIQLYIHI